MRISDWSSDVCSSDLGFADLPRRLLAGRCGHPRRRTAPKRAIGRTDRAVDLRTRRAEGRGGARRWRQRAAGVHGPRHPGPGGALPRRRTEPRSEEHTSELQSLMRISYAVFCLKKKKHKNNKL